MAKISVYLILLLAFNAFANPNFSNRKDVQIFIKNTAKKYHFDKKQLNLIMDQVVLQPQVIESMEKPFEKKNWDEYKALFLTPNRLEAGLNFWRENKKFLDAAEKKYKVPAEIIVAILGVETLYGTRQGEYRVLDALATLAFNYPKRSLYFTKELQEYLLLCREQKFPATYFIGSYAGAIGQPQFMPSSYRHYAIDFDKNGKADLLNNNADVIASVANYFTKHGWQPKAKTAEPADVRKQRRKLLTNPKAANYLYSQLRAAGIRPRDHGLSHPRRAALIALQTANNKEYWLAYPNFFVITRYNSSPQYALVVHLFSEQLKKHRRNN